MILNACVDAASLSLDTFLSRAATGAAREELELLLAFGATRNEACAPAFREAVRVAMTPTLNSMAVMGLGKSELLAPLLPPSLLRPRLL